MNASTAKHQARLAEWKSLVAECRSSGKSVRTWCAERNIGYKTYYRWEREILQITSEKLSETENLFLPSCLPLLQRKQSQ